MMKKDMTLIDVWEVEEVSFRWMEMIHCGNPWKEQLKGRKKPIFQFVFVINITEWYIYYSFLPLTQLFEWRYFQINIFSLNIFNYLQTSSF